MNPTHIIFDTREARLYSSFEGKPYPMKIEPLTIGDIAFTHVSESVPTGEDSLQRPPSLAERPPDLCARICQTHDVILFERKSLSDLLASIKDGRYEEQSHRLIHASQLASHRIVYIIEGMFSSLRNPAEKQLVISAMTSLQLYKGFSVVRTSSVQETADLIEGMWKKIQRNVEKGVAMFEPQLRNANDSAAVAEPQQTEIQAYSCVVKKVKKENVTPENIGEIILCQIPGISSTIAIELMRKYGNIRDLLDMIRERPDELKELKINGRRMGSNVVENIVRYLG